MSRKKITSRRLFSQQVFCRQVFLRPGVICGGVWLLLSIAASTIGSAAEPPAPTFEKIRLSDKFYAEGAYYGDFNRDGKLDVVAGPFWYEGPDFKKRHEYRPAKIYNPKEYSEDFLTYVGDFNGDGWPDILVIGLPGEAVYWYENPAGKSDGHWRRHLALKDVGNESPMWIDINGDGRPELIYNNTGTLGYATYDPKTPDKPWVFHAISGTTPQPQKFFCYTHGIGAGDINGDGRIDIVEKTGWWEQPPEEKAGVPWKFHPYHFADAAAEMFVYDVDGDGLPDVITAWNCHGYGLVWHQQIRGADGRIDWKRHDILSPTPDLKSSDLRISQLHALDLVDMNGDGLKDIVTGKRFWAHGPAGDVEPNAPAVLYWFELRRSKERGAEFIPHKIDDDSGVGTQVTAVDLNGDGTPDVIVSNKKGTFLFLSRPTAEKP
jgi:hypothetical protein